MRNYIHIVEDDEDIRYIIEYILTDMGYTIQVSETIAAFKKELKQNLPDMILLDVMLPDGNGLDLCSELKTDIKLSPIPILIMSAHTTEIEVLQLACAQDFISKPFDLEELIIKVGQLLPL